MAQQTLNPEETVLAEASDGTQLIVRRESSEVDVGDREGEIEVNLRSLDHAPATVRFRYPELEGEPSYSDMEFEKLGDARVAFGLWLRCGPFTEPESDGVPREVATDGQDAITAYIYVNKGVPLSREGTASICGVVEQTVSDRLTRIRWRPDEVDRGDGIETDGGVVYRLRCTECGHETESGKEWEISGCCHAPTETLETIVGGGAS